MYQISMKEIHFQKPIKACYIKEIKKFFETEKPTKIAIMGDSLDGGYVDVYTKTAKNTWKMGAGNQEITTSQLVEFLASDFMVDGTDRCQMKYETETMKAHRSTPKSKPIKPTASAKKMVGKLPKFNCKRIC